MEQRQRLGALDVARLHGEVLEVLGGDRAVAAADRARGARFFASSRVSSSRPPMRRLEVADAVVVDARRSRVTSVLIVPAADVAAPAAADPVCARDHVGVRDCARRRPGMLPLTPSPVQDRRRCRDRGRSGCRAGPSRRSPSTSRQGSEALVALLDLEPERACEHRPAGRAGTADCGCRRCRRAPRRGWSPPVRPATVLVRMARSAAPARTGCASSRARIQ